MPNCIYKAVDVKKIKASDEELWLKATNWRVQKAAFAIILENRYLSYSRALIIFRRTTLEQRRADLNLKFAKKSLTSEKYQHWFCPNEPSDQLSKPEVLTRIFWFQLGVEQKDLRNPLLPT